MALSATKPKSVRIVIPTVTSLRSLQCGCVHCVLQLSVDQFLDESKTFRGSISFFFISSSLRTTLVGILTIIPFRAHIIMLQFRFYIIWFIKANASPSVACGMSLFPLCGAAVITTLRYHRNCCSTRKLDTQVLHHRVTVTVSWHQTYFFIIVSQFTQIFWGSWFGLWAPLA